MSFIKERDIKAKIAADGAMATAVHFKEALQKGHIDYKEMPGIRCLYENFMTEKGNDKLSCGHHILREETLTEEGGTLTAVDAFNVITSQIYFNALTTFYNSADFTVQNLFRVIPSNIVSGEKFGGISNLNTAIQPTPFNRELVALEPTQDYTSTPPMRQIGALVDIGLPMMKADATGEIMDMMQRLGSAVGTTRELEAMSVLTDIGSDASRTELVWKDTKYSTYQSSTPWVNVVGSNALLTLESLNTALQALNNIVDPYTGLPVVTPPGRLKLIVTPQLAFLADNLKRGTSYRFTGSTTNYSPAETTDATPPHEFDVVVSKYLKYFQEANSGLATTWFLGYPDMAFSWQQMYAMNVSEALPNAGQMFRRNIAASYKCFKIETAYSFNPRYMCKNTVA